MAPEKQKPITSPTSHPSHGDEEDMHSPSVGWQQLTLGTECDILAGFGFPERFQGKTSGDLPFFKVGDISETWKRGEVFLTRANHYVSRAESRELRAKPLPENTTVFAKIGAAIALNRRAILSEPSLVDNNVMGLHPASDKLDYRFLFHFVCTLRLDELSRATTVPSIRKSDIEAIMIPVPPLPEQRRIVAEIEKQFTRLEAGVAALRRVQANLKRYRAAVLKAACEGRLVPTEADVAKAENRKFETGEELLARILIERRQLWQGRGKYKEPAAADTTELGPRPEAWAWATVEQLCSLVTDGDHNPPRRHEGGLPHLTAKHVRNWRLDATDCTFISATDAERVLKRYDPVAGDLIITCVGTVGRTAIVPSDFRFSPDRNLAAVRLVGGGASTRYLNVVLSSPGHQELIKGASGSTAQPHLYLGDLRALSIPLPPLAEQTRIVAEGERRLSVVEEIEAVVSANLQRAGRLRQSILQKAFSGGLV